MPVKIFFSHAWADKANANVKIAMNELQNLKGYEIWLDRYEISLGENISSVIEKSIAESDVVIVAWSRNASKNKHVLQELKFAEKYNKPVVPCVIDGFINSQSKYVKDLKWIEIKGNQKFDIPQLMFLRNYLIDIQIQKLESSGKGKSIEKEIAILKESQKTNSSLMKELEDIHHRQKIGASGNDAGDVYIQTALEQAINVSALSKEEKVKEFFVRMMDISKRFPGAENNDIKIKYLEQTIIDLDPEKKDIEFQEFVKGSLELDIMMTNNIGAGTGGNERSDDVTQGPVESEKSEPEGNFIDIEWYGIRLFLWNGEVRERYPNGCKVYFPGYGTATIYLFYNYHTGSEPVAEYLTNCVERMKSQGTDVETSNLEYPSEAAVAIEMAYYNNNNELQFEYLGGYSLEDHRGFIIEIITTDKPVSDLFRALFEENLYLLDEQEPESKKDDSLFNRLSDRKLLSLSSSSSGYGSFYSASSTQKHFKLNAKGYFEFYYLASSNASGAGSLYNEEHGYGRWGVYHENSKDYLWFKWQEGQYELCELTFGNDADVYLGEAKYYIVALDYTV
jgi:hypothetical protein